ncbi:peptidylprolyl isomerase [Herbidospora mongoliensis]|uniref:peptidylprolyl isomerase n=1 Tax=Herbidospora mongoliensis TaxID=688067 RepID=UPI0009FCC52F|nr:peptidylprolyl isomerase [Herbidospora mongoliensis]
MILSIVAMTGCSGDDAENPPPGAAEAAPSAIPSQLPPPSKAPPIDPKNVTCDYRKDDSGAPAKFVGMPPAKPSAAAMAAKTMTLATNQGSIVIELTPDSTPCTVNSFHFLAKKNYFDSTVCHRLTTVKSNALDLLQCGDPQAKGDGKNKTDGTGGPGYLFPDENLGPAYNRGVVFMAQNSDAANSNGSQFVISYSNEAAQLPADYTPFGVVVKGLDVVDKIAAGGVNTAVDGIDITSETGGSNAPKLKVLIEDVTVN